MNAMIQSVIHGGECEQYHHVDSAGGDDDDDADSALADATASPHPDDHSSPCLVNSTQTPAQQTDPPLKSSLQKCKRTASRFTDDQIDRMRQR